MTKIKRALISVSDKSGLMAFTRALHQHDVEIFSTGGTLQTLKEAHISARSVSDLSGFPEILEGRVKTLHPKIHGGILYRRGKKSDQREVAEHKILPIDLVVVNLYPFTDVIRKKGVSFETAIENMDIGGPTLLRAAAKNFESVVAVTDPADYEMVLEAMRKNSGKVPTELRLRLAQKVFETTSLYDNAIAHYLKEKIEDQKDQAVLPQRLDVIYEKAKDLRYGENPHQRAALYQRIGKPRFDFRSLHGKELSFNNLLDIAAAVDVIREFENPAACVIKHTNPCGIAEGKNLTEALEKAVEGDSMSAFGGIIGLNRSCDLATAKRLYGLLPFLEVVVAPQFQKNALEFLETRKNVRLVEVGPISEGGPWDLRFTKFGILLQDRDRPIRWHENELKKKLRWVTKIKLENEDLEELLFAWKCVKTVRSNAIVITQAHQTVGIGAGQMSRVDAVEIACKKAMFRSEGGALASDAFFPMPDSIELAHKAGIRAIIQPGGSIRDEDVIKACDQWEIAMVLTGERHFRH